MYFLKFLKWFWFTYLTDTGSRIMASITIWVPMFIVFFGIAIILNEPVILGWFAGISASIAIFIAICMGISFMHKRYIEWQSQVFDKLKGE